MNQCGRRTIFSLLLLGALAVLGFFYCIKLFHNPKNRFNLENLQQKDALVPILIIGAGPAGLSAAIFTGRAQFKTFIVAGSMNGGQIAEAAYVENWPGIEGKDSGAHTIAHVRKQALRFGTKIISDSVESLDCSAWPFVVTLGDGTVLNALSIILAMGGEQKTLDIPGVREYWGKGIGVCSICDAPFDKNKSVAIIGGGDSAADKALQSAAYADHVTLLVKNDTMHAAAVIQDYVKTTSSISILYDVEPTAILGDGSTITGLAIKDVKTDTITTLSVQRVYFALGFTPNSDLVKQCVNLDQDGYVKLYDHSTQTSQKGIFAAGNIEDSRYQKGSVASGRGVSAAIDAIEFLQSIGFTPTNQQHYKEKLYISEQ